MFIADALMHEAKGDPDETLRTLKTRSDGDSRSALFLALVRQRGVEAAFAWTEADRLAPTDFNAPGVMNLVLKEIERGRFEKALEHISGAPEAHFNQCLALRLLRAQLVVASILPDDQKGLLFQGLPLNPKMLQLAGSQSARQALQRAAEDLRAILAVADELNLGYLKDFLSEFELWLRLEDSATQAAARDQLAVDIKDSEKTLRRVRLALAYGVPFNEEALQRHLNSRKEIGGWTPDERFAAFLMAFHSDDPKKISEFFDKHHDDLFSQTDITRSALAGIEIEVLARTGRFEDARAHLKHHAGPDLSPGQVSQLGEVIAYIEKGDEIESLRARYASSGSLGDLRLLVSGLRARRDAKQLAEYAPILARQTRTADDFDVAIKSLFQSDRMGDIIAFAADLPELCGLDDEYAAIKGWALYGLGRVLEARTIARELIQRRGTTNDRELAINTAIESGDWGNLQALLAREVQRVDSLPVADLIRLSRLALEAASPYVDRFRDAALQNAPDNPEVHLNAYILATERGEEYRGDQAQQWFQKAIALSGPTGPVRSVPMRDLVDQSKGSGRRSAMPTLRTRGSATPSSHSKPAESQRHSRTRHR